MVSSLIKLPLIIYQIDFIIARLGHWKLMQFKLTLKSVERKPISYCMSIRINTAAKNSCIKRILLNRLVPGIF